MNDTLTEAKYIDDATGKELEVQSWSGNILIAAILAKIYSEADYNAPIQNWAYAVSNRDLMILDKTYRAGPMRRRINGLEVTGIQLSIIDQLGDCLETHFFPIETFKSFNFQILGVKIR